MTEWKTLLGRLTVFPVVAPSSPLPASNELYRMMWGEGPDSFQKAQNPLVPSTAQGRRNGITMTCALQPARIDFNLMGTPTQPTELPLIRAADINSELRRMIGAIGKREVAIAASRVALFIQFLVPSDATVDANKILVSTIPNGLKLSDEEEVIFQVNRRYQSKQLPKINMNGIIKWSVDSLQITAVALPTAFPTLPSGGAPLVREIKVASVTFDVNNRPEGITLDGQQQSVILLEALSFVSETQRAIGLNVEGL